jgi:hypothetical protein
MHARTHPPTRLQRCARGHDPLLLQLDQRLLRGAVHHSRGLARVAGVCCCCAEGCVRHGPADGARGEVVEVHLVPAAVMRRCGSGVLFAVACCRCR